MKHVYRYMLERSIEIQITILMLIILLAVWISFKLHKNGTV